MCKPEETAYGERKGQGRANLEVVGILRKRFAEHHSPSEEKFSTISFSPGHDVTRQRKLSRRTIKSHDVFTLTS